jgi:hypothetical protein
MFAWVGLWRSDSRGSTIWGDFGRDDHRSGHFLWLQEPFFRRNRLERSGYDDRLQILHTRDRQSLNETTTSAVD